jgi:hypothetical protein
MLFPPKRVVHATTEQEIDAALATADQVIVQGDDQLLSYAVGKASADPQNKITVETGEVTTAITPAPPDAQAKASRWAPLKAASSKAPLVVAIVAIGAIVSLVVATALKTDAPRVQTTSGASSPTISGQSNNNVTIRPRESSPTLSTTQGTAMPDNYTLTLVQTLVWPVVTIISIIALSLIAWKAIVGGRNVEITWKVTEKVQGKVVITKHRAAAKPRRAVA